MIRALMLAVLILFPVTLVKSTEPAPEMKDKVVYVAAFKNGLGFFLREGEAKLQSGWGTTKAVPEAALGTFWITPTKDGARIEQLVAIKDEAGSSKAAVNIRELLAGNVGKTATFGVQDKTFSGTILSVPEARKPEEQPQPRGYYSPAPQPDPNTIVLLQNDTGTLAVNVSQINWLQISGSANTNSMIPSTERKMKFKVSGAGDSCAVSTAYVQKGITWSPSYLIELVGEDKAKIAMQGLLANDVEDLENVNVSFVVGYPNFAYSNILSPLAMRQSVNDFIQALAGGGSDSYRQYAPAMSQSVIYNYARSDAIGSAADLREFTYNTVTETPGAQEEDLFLYRKTGVTLKKGERAYYDIFSAVVPYEHIYEWESLDETNVNPDGYVSSSREDERNRMPKDQVWHKIKLTNTSGYPWTTAPAFTLSGHQPLAQDTMDYTSKGGHAKVKLTVATDLKAKAEEEELSREQATFGNRSFWKVTSKGRLSLASFKTKPVTVQVTKYMTGEVIQVSDGGKSVKVTKGIKAVNPTSTVTWSVPLKPGEEKVVEYTYSTLVSY